MEPNSTVTDIQSLMSTAKPTLCPAALDFINFTPQHVIMAIQILFSLMTIVVNVLFVHACAKNIYFHKNMKLLIFLTVADNIVHSIFLTILQTVHLVRIYTVTDPCDVLVSSNYCIYVRLPASICLNATVTISLGVVVERAIASRNLTSHEQSSGLLGYVIGVCSVLFAVAIGSYGTINYQYDQLVPYCTAATKTTLPYISSSSYFVFALEMVIIVFFGWLYIYNKNQLKKSIYDVRHKYQSKENLNVLKLLTPMVLFHFIVYSLFMFANAIASTIRPLFTSSMSFQAYVSAVYIIPVYTVIAPLILWWILQRHRKTRSAALIKMALKPLNERELYFSNYGWNDGAP